jgi:hypothetical protein
MGLGKNLDPSRDVGFLTGEFYSREHGLGMAKPNRFVPVAISNHLLVACVFSRQAWYNVLHKLGLQNYAPQPHTSSFDDWWEHVDKAVAALSRKGLNTVIILLARSIWNHRNRCVFDGQQPALGALLAAFQENLYQWELVGAQGVADLLALNLQR